MATFDPAYQTHSLQHYEPLVCGLFAQPPRPRL